MGIHAVDALHRPHRSNVQLEVLNIIRGRWHAAVAEKDKELAAPRLDLALQFAASRMGSGDTEQSIQAALGLGGVSGERAVLQLRSSLADTDGPAQVITEFRRHHAVAAVDGVLNVAQDVGQADLVHLPQLLLAGVAVGAPHLGSMIPQNVGGHRPSPAGGDGVQHSLIGLEHPLPVGHAVNPGCGFVRGDDGSGQELGLDRRAGGIERRPHAAEGIGDGAFGDAQPKHLLQQARQPLEADMMAVMQVGQQRADPWAEGRSRKHGGGRFSPIAPSTRTAAAAEQLHPRHHRADFWQVNVVVAMPAALSRCQQRRLAVRAFLGKTALRAIRVGRERPRDTGTGRPRFAPPLRLAGLAPGAILRRWDVRVRRGLLRLADQGFQFGDPCGHALDQRRLLDQQGVLLGVTETIARRNRHGDVDGVDDRCSPASRCHRLVVAESHLREGRPHEHCHRRSRSCQARLPGSWR